MVTMSLSSPMKDEDANIICGIDNNNGQQTKTSSTTIKPKAVFSLKDEKEEHIDYSNDYVNKVLSEKLNNMSTEDRNHAMNELHGVADDATETFEDLVRKLQEMNEAIGTLPMAKKGDYQKAVETNDEYVERIKIFCLRADNYDTQKAAARIVSFFAFKKSLFGEDKLAREIVLGDVDDEVVQAFKKGAIQILKEKDRAGRTVIVMAGLVSKQYTIKTLGPLYFYVNMVAMRDPETQKNGAVFILYNVGNTGVLGGDRAEKLAQVLWLLPVRIVAAHYCYDDPKLEVFEKTMSTAMEGYYLCRFRSHFGSDGECNYKLAAFGIPNLVTADGQFDFQWLRRWVDNTRAQEKLQFSNLNNDKSSPPSPSAVSCDEDDNESDNQIFKPEAAKSSGVIQQKTRKRTTILHPGPMDIIARKGRYANDSESYRQFRSILESRLAEYNDSGYGEKRLVADAVLQELRSTGYRLLKHLPEGCFVECDDAESRDKITHAFRTLRQRQQQQVRKMGSIQR